MPEGCLTAGTPDTGGVRQVFYNDIKVLAPFYRFFRHTQTHRGDFSGIRAHRIDPIRTSVTLSRSGTDGLCVYTIFFELNRENIKNRVKMPLTH
jgi:hypothetical protein